jgi:hypothetical protein
MLINVQLVDQSNLELPDPRSSNDYLTGTWASSAKAILTTFQLTNSVFLSQ